MFRMASFRGIIEERIPYFQRKMYSATKHAILFGPKQLIFETDKDRELLKHSKCSE